jgi:Cu/Zn superoxide dismutase
MRAENNSRESGTATLTQTAKGVHIVVEVKNAPSTAQPTHIHPGTCAKLNPAPEYPLTSLANGKTVTDLPGKKLSDLTGGKFSINVHKSADDLKTYVSCGQIK